MIKREIRLSMGLLLVPFLLTSCSDDENKTKKEEKVIMSQKKQAETKTIEIHTMFEVAYYGQPQLIQRYLDHNHSINGVDKNGATPIYYAIQTNQVDAIQPFIDKGADIEHKNSL